MKLITFILLGLASLNSFAAITSVELDLFDRERERPVKIRVWYQNSPDCTAKLCVKDHLAKGKLPIALISHGAFGSPREMNWLGYGMASQGWLAVGVAHYGESWVYGRDTIDYASMGKKWLRAQDLSFVLDEFLAQSLTELPIDKERVTVLGHSIGGYSVLNMVGADYNFDTMLEYCKTAIATDRGCRYGKSQAGEQKVAKVNDIDVVDKRVKAVVSLDPALGPSVSKEALTNIQVPTLIVGSVDNDFLNYSAHADYYASSIDGAKLVTLAEGEGHFVYLDKCEHSHQAMGVSLCKDREGVDRTKVHNHLLSEITSFVSKL